MQFQDLKISDVILEALTKLQYREPTDVQTSVIPMILNHQDCIVKARTGSGKTAAFAIPLIEEMVWDENKPQALVLAPTRELALQIKADFDMIGTYKRIKALAIYGKQPYKQQTLDLKQKCHVVIGTPGRVLDHLQRGTFPISQLRYLIIDEADELLKMGFIEAVKEIITYLPQERVNCLFSATLQETIQEFADGFMHQPELIEIQNSQASAIVSYAYEIKEHEKKAFLLKLILHEMPSSAIIFAKTQEHVDEICAFLYERGLSVDKIHGGLMQEDRIENMEDFRHGELQFLIATDVASRGIDVKDVALVVNYDLPEEKERFIHRIGRTGRMHASGKAITFLSEYDDLRKQTIEEYIEAQLQILDKSSILEIQVHEKNLTLLSSKCIRKPKKNKALQEDILRLYLNGGKNKKIRPGDIVGAVCEIDGVDGDDIGVIQVQENGSYVDILHGKGKKAYEALKQKTIKGKKLRIEISKRQG